MIKRRTLFASAPALLAGCAVVNGTATPSETAQDASAIAAGLQAAIPAIAALSGISPVAMGVVGAAVSDLQTASTAFAQADSAAAAKALAARIGSDADAVLKAVAGFSLPGPLGAIIEAVNVLLPAILAVTGVANLAIATVMTPAQARSVLQKAASK